MGSGDGQTGREDRRWGDQAFPQPKGSRDLYSKLILAHCLRADDVIQAAQILFEHLNQEASGVIDQYRAKNNICKAVDIFLFAQIVDEEFAETVSVAETPSKKVDAGNKRFRVFRKGCMFAVKLGL